MEKEMKKSFKETGQSLSKIKLKISLSLNFNTLCFKNKTCLN